jgi:hypothetical protein
MKEHDNKLDVMSDKHSNNQYLLLIMKYEGKVKDDSKVRLTDQNTQ